MAIENLKKHLILSLLEFDITFWRFIYSQQEKRAALSYLSYPCIIPLTNVWHPILMSELSMPAAAGSEAL